MKSSIKHLQKNVACPADNSREIKTGRKAAISTPQRNQFIQEPSDVSGKKSFFWFRDKLKLPGVWAAGWVASIIASNYKCDREHHETLRRRSLATIVVSVVGSLGVTAIPRFLPAMTHEYQMFVQVIIALILAFICTGALCLIFFDMQKGAERIAMQEETKREETRLRYELEKVKVEAEIKLRSMVNGSR